MRHGQRTAHPPSNATNSVDEACLATTLRQAIAKAAAMRERSGPGRLNADAPLDSGCVTFVNRETLADVLGDIGLSFAAPTLASRATRGGGPPYTIVSRRATYLIDDVVSWLLPMVARRVSSTSERSPSPPGKS